LSSLVTSLKEIEILTTTKMKELISISVYKDVMIDVNEIEELKEKLANLLGTETDNISIELK
jgi:hypothetical protein